MVYGHEIPPVSSSSMKCSRQNSKSSQVGSSERTEDWGGGVMMKAKLGRLETKQKQT